MRVMGRQSNQQHWEGEAWLVTGDPECASTKGQPSKSRSTVYTIGHIPHIPAKTDTVSSSGLLDIPARRFAAAGEDDNLNTSVVASAEDSRFIEPP